MKQCHRRAVLAWTVTGWFCLLVACTPMAVDETTGNTEPATATAGDTATSGEQADAKPQDIIDRMFSPLDEAVTDINRDLNKGDAGSAAPSETDE